MGDADEHLGGEADVDDGVNVLDVILGGSDEEEPDEGQSGPASAISAKGKKDAHLGDGAAGSRPGTDPYGAGAQSAPQAERQRRLLEERGRDADRPGAWREPPKERERVRDREWDREADREREREGGDRERRENNWDAPRPDALRYEGGAPRHEGGAPRYEGGAQRYEGGAQRYEGGAQRYDVGAPRFDGGAPAGQDGGDWTRPRREHTKDHNYEHRVLLACKSGGDAWLDRHLITKIFSRHGKVLDVFLPFGRKMAFVSFQDGEVLEQVLCIQQMNIENCQVTLTRAKKKEDGGVNLNARDLIAESSSASHTPRVYDSGPSQAPHTPRDARSPPRGWDNGSTLGKRDRVGEGGDPGRNDPLPSSSDNWPRPVCGVGMTLLEATRESNGCCVVSDIKRGGPADLSGRVRVGDHLVRAGGNNCVGIKREVIKTFVVGPSGSVVELEFARGQESIVVQLKRFAPPKQNEDTQLASLPPPGSAHADDWHKRPRFDSHMQAPAVEMPPPRESTAVQRDPRYDRGDLRATNFPPARSYHDGGSALDGRDGRPMGSFRDGGREGARGPPRDMYDQRADAKFPVRDEREQLQAGSGGGMGPRDMRRPERDDRTHDSRDAYPRGNEGNFRQDNQRSAMQGPPRGRSRSRSPPRGYHDERGPPPAGGYDNRRNNDERGAPPSGGYNKRSPPPIDRNRLQENRVFMTAIGGGLGWLNKDAIKYAMMQHGKVLQVFIPHGKKFAYVSFESGAAMEDVIRKRDFEFEGCKVRVDVAKPQGETKEGETSAPSFFHGGRPAPSFGQDRPHGRDTGLGNGFPAERNGRESRQYSGGGRDNHDFRDQSRLSSCAEDPHDSNPGNFPNPGIRNSVRSLSPPFSHCQSLESSVADRWSRSESLNFAAGNFRETRQGVSQDKSARAHQPTALDQDDISRLHVSQGHRSVGEKRRVVGVLNARPDPALAALQAARVMRSSVTYQSNDRSDRLLDREYETAGREAKNGEASRLHAMTPLFNKDAGDSAFDRQAPGVLVGDDTRLIKHEISWSSPHAVLDWLDKTSLDSVSLEKLLEAIGRCGDLLLPSAIDYPSHLPRIREESSAAQPLQVLQQCVRLVPAVGHRFLSNSSSSRGASAAAHRTTHRQATHETKDTPNFGKSAHLQSNVCPYFVVGRCNWGLDCRFEHALPADSCVRDSVSRGGNEVGSTAHHKADGRVPAVVNGRLVCTAVAGVARIYSRALHHYFADRTHVLARDVCAQCRNALSAMCCSAASHLEAEISREAHNGLNDRVDPCTGDAIEAMRVIAMLANDVADAAHGTRVDCDVSSTAVQQQLQQCMHAVGRWLVLLLAPSKRSSFRSAHAATSLTSQRTEECASDGVIDRASDNVRMPELARAPDDKSQRVAPLTIHDTVQVFSSFANVGCLPREELLSRLSLPLLTEGEQEMQVSEYCPQILDYVAALDASHVCLLITGVARLPCTENRMLVPLLKVLLEKATKKHVLEKMEMRQCVSLLTAFPYLAPKRQASLEEPPQQHNDSLPQALRLFRAVVEHLAEGMQDLDVPLDTPALARIARAHSRHWQGLDGIAGAMSLHLAKLAAIPTAVTGTSNACTAGASVQAQTEVGREGGKGGVEGALAAMTAEAGGADGGLGAAVGAPSSSKLVFTRLMDCADLLLGFSLVGSHEVPHSQGGARRTWALIEAALETCHRNTNVLERFTAAHVIVELLWSLSVAASSDNLRAGAGEGEGKTGNIEENARSRQGLREQLDALQARLLLLLARRYYARELSFAAGTQFVDADAASAGARARRARAEGLSDAASRASDGEATGAHEGPREELLGVHAEMVLQVVLVAPGGMLQDNRIQGLVKHVKEQGRQRDLARIERNTSMLDDMHQVLKSISARVRHSVELGDGGCVLCFMLEAEDYVASPDQTPDIDASPSVSIAQTASTEVDTLCGVSSRGMIRSLSSVKDLHSLRSSAMRTAAGSVGTFDASDVDVIEVYDARRDCLQRPSHLRDGMAYHPAGVWLQRVRLLRRRGFTVLQVGTEQWAGLVRAEGGAGSDDGADLAAAAARSSRAEWLMKLINTAAWARSLVPFRRGIALPSTGAPPLSEARTSPRHAASAASHVSSGAWCALPFSPRDAIGNHVDANAVAGAECDADQKGEASVVDAGGAIVDDFELGESASSWIASRSAAAHAAALQQGGKDFKVWSLYWSKSKQQWFYHNNATNDKVWKPPPVDGWEIHPRDAEAVQAPGAAYTCLQYYYYNPLTKTSAFEPPQSV